MTDHLHTLVLAPPSRARCAAPLASDSLSTAMHGRGAEGQGGPANDHAQPLVTAQSIRFPPQSQTGR